MAIHQWTFPREPAQIRNMPRAIAAMKRIVNATVTTGVDAVETQVDGQKNIATGKLEDGLTDRISVAYDGRIEVQGVDPGEVFAFPGTVSNSCDTGDKAYDLLVLACLAVAKVNLRGDITITSPASRGQWNQAVTVASQVLGDDVPNPLDDV
jgi:hypothetical protein